jgi:hypothetical protein
LSVEFIKERFKSKKGRKRENDDDTLLRRLIATLLSQKVNSFCQQLCRPFSRHFLSWKTRFNFDLDSSRIAIGKSNLVNPQIWIHQSNLYIKVWFNPYIEVQSTPFLKVRSNPYLKVRSNPSYIYEFRKLNFLSWKTRFNFDLLVQFCWCFVRQSLNLHL